MMMMMMSETFIGSFQYLFVRCQFLFNHFFLCCSIQFYMKFNHLESMKGRHKPEQIRSQQQRQQQQKKGQTSWTNIIANFHSFPVHFYNFFFFLVFVFAKKNETDNDNDSVFFYILLLFLTFIFLSRNLKLSICNHSKV